MTSILTAVGSAMREAHQDKTRATLAEQATGWVKPLVMMTAGVINGASEADVEEIMANLIAFSSEVAHAASLARTVKTCQRRASSATN